MEGIGPHLIIDPSLMRTGMGCAHFSELICALPWPIAGRLLHAPSVSSPAPISSARCDLVFDALMLPPRHLKERLDDRPGLLHSGSVIRAMAANCRLERRRAAIVHNQMQVGP